MLDISTKIWKIVRNQDDNQAIKEIAQGLRDGKIIAFPTETVYGLGANALNTNAVKRIFEAKGRPNDNPLIVHIGTKEQLSPLVEKINEKAQRLIDTFWPGPLTIIFKAKGDISDIVTAGLTTVAIRMPNHPIALKILEEANVPIAAPSANRSGKPSPTNANHVKNDLDGLIDGIVDGGPTGVGLESTVIDVSEDIPIVLRPGGVTIEELEKVLGRVKLDPAILKQEEKPKSPGMKYKHYAPTGEMLIVQGETMDVIQRINQLAKEKAEQGNKVGVLTLKSHIELIKNGKVILGYGTVENLYPYAEKLYDALRIFDNEGVDYILVEGVEEKGIGLTIMNRLIKAAGGNVLKLN